MSQATEILKCSRQNVHELIKKEKIKALKVGDINLFFKDELEQMNAKMSKNEFFVEMEKHLNQKGDICSYDKSRSYLNTRAKALPYIAGTIFSIWRRKSENEVLLSIQAQNEKASKIVKELFEKHEKEFREIDENITIEPGKTTEKWTRISIRVRCNDDFEKILSECKEKSILLINEFNRVSKHKL